MIIEDLYIIDDENLLFSAGNVSNKLNRIYKSKYTIENGVVHFRKLIRHPHISSKDYVRLGNVNQHEVLVYSKRGVGVIGSTVKIFSRTAAQPFQIENDTYYTEFSDDSPLANSIYCNNKLLFHLDDVNQKLGKKYIEGGNPYVVDDNLFFEANTKKDSLATWDILVYNLKEKTFRHMISGAANPAFYDGKLFYCDMAEAAADVKKARFRKFAIKTKDI
jgi:hypothetical protein